MAGDSKRKRSDGAGVSSNKRKFYDKGGKAAIPLQSRGFLISCINGKERQAAQEASSLLSEHLEEAPLQQPLQQSVQAADFTKLLEDEVQALKGQQGKLLEWHKTNVSGLIYLSLTKAAGSIDPVTVVTKLAKEVQQTKQCRSRLCMRFLPVQTVCHASLDSIRSAFTALSQQSFGKGIDSPSLRFAVQYEHRASVSLNRGEVIDAIVESVPQPPHVVNLTDPDRTVIVQLIKSCCALSVVERYKQLAKFNLRELSINKEQAATGTAPALKAATSKDSRHHAQEPADADDAAETDPAAQAAIVQKGSADDRAEVAEGEVLQSSQTQEV